MKYIYEENEIRRLQAGSKKLLYFALGIAAVALLVLLVICCFTNYKNTGFMENLACGLAILVGWLEIYL